jgi:hypothetical protein
MAKRTITTPTKASLLKEMNLKILKLYNAAFKMVPGSARQKKVMEEISSLQKLHDHLKNKK